MNSINSTHVTYRHCHAMARHWASDIDFYKIEMRFLHHLLHDYFIRLSAPEYIDELKDLGRKLLQLEKDKYSADIHLIEYLKHLEGQTEDLLPEHVELLTVSHEQIEDEMLHLTKTYRALKQQLFLQIQQVIKAQQKSV